MIRASFLTLAYVVLYIPNGNALQEKYRPLKDDEYCEVDFAETLVTTRFGTLRYCHPCEENYENKYPQHQQKCTAITETAAEENDDHEASIFSTTTEDTKPTATTPQTEQNGDQDEHMSSATKHDNQAKSDKEADDQKTPHSSTKIYASTPSIPDQNVENAVKKNPSFNPLTLLIPLAITIILIVFAVIIYRRYENKRQKELEERDALRMWPMY